MHINKVRFWVHTLFISYSMGEPAHVFSFSLNRMRYLHFQNGLNERYKSSSMTFFYVQFFRDLTFLVEYEIFGHRCTSKLYFTTWCRRKAFILANRTYSVDHFFISDAGSLPGALGDKVGPELRYPVGSTIGNDFRRHSHQRRLAARDEGKN